MRLAFVMIVIVALAALPKIASPYYLTLVLPAFAYAIALLGFNLLFGYTGLLSFGHALFVAVGAYGSAVLSSKLGVKSFEWVLLLSWVPIAGDALCVAAGWLRVNPWLALLMLALGKCARYLLVAGGWAWMSSTLG